MFLNDTLVFHLNSRLEGVRLEIRHQVSTARQPKAKASKTVHAEVDAKSYAFKAAERVLWTAETCLSSSAHVCHDLAEVCEGDDRTLMTIRRLLRRSSD